MALLLMGDHLCDMRIFAYILILTVVVFAISHFQKTYYFAGLNSIPGPFFSTISVLPRLRSVYGGKSHLDDLELHARYGRIVRLSPHLVSVADPTLVDHLYGISTRFFKSGFYEPLRFHDGDGPIPDPFVTADRETHSRIKRNAANAYSLQAVSQLEPVVDSVIKRLFVELDRLAREKALVDMGEYMHRFALDAIFSITFGRDPDFLGNGDQHNIFQRLREGLLYFVLVGQIPWMHAYLLGSPIVQKMLAWAGEDSLVSSVMTIATEQRAQAEAKLRVNEDDDETDQNSPYTFLMRLIRNKKKSPESITDREINAHTFGNITAGGDTTSTALRAILIDLVRYPEVKIKVLAELSDHGLLSGSKEAAVVSYMVASKLLYLRAVIKESMRIHSPVGMVLARGVPPQGTTLTDANGREYRIGAGAEIGINPWIIHRDPTVFPDPLAYRPERWLDSPPDQLRQMNRAYIPFGAGRHTCSGQHISMMEMTKLVPSLLLRYHITAPSSKLSGLPGISIVNHFFTIQSGVVMEVSRREQ